MERCSNHALEIQLPKQPFPSLNRFLKFLYGVFILGRPPRLVWIVIAIRVLCIAEEIHVRLSLWYCVQAPDYKINWSIWWKTRHTTDCQLLFDRHMCAHDFFFRLAWTNDRYGVQGRTSTLWWWHIVTGMEWPTCCWQLLSNVYNCTSHYLQQCWSIAD